jgi:methylated-DNA-[protein]-cysteine S-methyltransferase
MNQPNVALEMLHDEIETPLGRLRIVVDGAGRLCLLGWIEGHARLEQLGPSQLFQGSRHATDPHGSSSALRAYFEGDVHAIDELPVALHGTSFQGEVWSALREIPCGETWSYARLARHIGRPSAVRAVGLANGKNPVGIVVPCHRVIGADGSLTGYGGGLERKRWLLEHERARGVRSTSLAFSFAEQASVARKPAQGGRR